jgi:hypothetical protein
MVGLIPVLDVVHRQYVLLSPAECRALFAGTSAPAYVGGPTGAIVVDNTKTPPEIDIDTSIVPRKGISETIRGLWTFVQGRL